MFAQEVSGITINSVQTNVHQNLSPLSIDLSNRTKLVWELVNIFYIAITTDSTFAISTLILHWYQKPENCFQSRVHKHCNDICRVDCMLPFSSDIPQTCYICMIYHIEIKENVRIHPTGRFCLHLVNMWHHPTSSTMASHSRHSPYCNYNRPAWKGYDIFLDQKKRHAEYEYINQDSI